MTLAMMRDHWWWPWWVSTLIDIGIVVVALAVMAWTSRRAVRLVAAVFVVIGVVGAIMAPIVMKEKPDRGMNQPPNMMR